MSFACSGDASIQLSIHNPNKRAGLGSGLALGWLPKKLMFFRSAKKGRWPRKEGL